jgi:hypothetical protein
MTRTYGNCMLWLLCTWLISARYLKVARDQKPYVVETFIRLCNKINSCPWICSKLVRSNTKQHFHLFMSVLNQRLEVLHDHATSLFHSVIRRVRGVEGRWEAGLKVSLVRSFLRPGSTFRKSAITVYITFKVLTVSSPADSAP